MKTISDYLADYASACGISSDYAIAKRLSLTRQAVSKYRRGIGAPGIDTCWQIADAISEPPGAVIAAAELQRAMCSEDKQRANVWRARLSAVSDHAGKVFSVVALLPATVQTAAQCILCQIEPQPFPAK